MRVSANPNNSKFGDRLRSTRHHRIENPTRVGLSPILTFFGHDRYLRILAIASQSVNVPLIASPLLNPTRPASNREGVSTRLGNGGIL
jgi:hypothetical protein